MSDHKETVRVSWLDGVEGRAPILQLATPREILHLVLDEENRLTLLDQFERPHDRTWTAMAWNPEDYPAPGGEA